MCNITFASEVVLSQASIKEYLKTKKLPSSWKAIDENNVDFPIVKILQAFVADQAVNPVTVINTLEPVMTRTRFELQKPDADSLRSYFFWRDLMYSILSRSFYETHEYEKSYKYASAVQVESPFYRIAKLQQIWAGLSLERYKDVQTLLANLSSLNLEPLELVTLRLQSAFLMFQDKKYEEAIKLCESVHPISPVLKAYSNNLLAQAYFELHQLNVLDTNEVKKIRLEKILTLIGEIKVKEKLSQFAYFAAEVYWAYASLFRIIDPIQHHKKIMETLSKADSYIKPWVLKSIEKKKPLLVEEAMFLAAVVLWEQEKKEESIPRLLLTIEMYPGTQYKEDIYQLIADYYFEQGRYNESLTYYSLLSRSENVEKVAYGIYKAAWAFYNLKEKYKALRHFQRLVLHYKKEKINVDQTLGTLYRESEVDMFLVMGELLTAEQSLKELEIFKYSNSDWDDVREKMSNTYKSLGKFEESVFVLKDLLAHHTQNDNYYSWLYEVLTNQLNIGLRNDIANTIETYLSADQYQGSKQDFENKIVNLQLTLHREAKKSDDTEIWRATDAMYRVISQLAPNSQNGDFWYFGAQRKEMKDQAWEAVTWYKKAIGIPGYVNKNDAALSILRIVRVQIDKENLDDKIVNFQNCKEAAAWYIENFPDTEQKYSAIQFYLKSLLNLKEYEQAENYILTSLEKNHFASQDWNNYRIYNKELYAQQLWQATYSLADRIIRGSATLAAQNDLFLREIRQESAFQFAYQLETDEKQKDILKAREWYLKSVEVSQHNDNLKVKAWNNLLRTHHMPDEIDLLIKMYEKFKNENFNNLSNENRLLLVNSYAFVAKAFEDIGYPIRKFEVLLKSSRFEIGENQNLLRWNTLIGFGTHYDLAHFNETLKLLEGQNILEDPINKTTLARLFFLLGIHDRAWTLIQDIWQTKKVTPAYFVLLRDFYSLAEQDNLQILNQVQDWLEKRENTEFKKEPLLESIWTRRKWAAIQKTFEKTPLKNMSFNSNRSLASVAVEREHRDPNANVNVNAVANESNEQLFNERLAQVSMILVNLVENKQRIKRAYGNSISQLIVEGLCLKVGETKKAIKDLELRREPEINSDKWGHFIGKLNTKILELEAEANKEEQICSQKHEEIALLDTLKVSDSVLCMGGKCPSRMPASDIESIKRESLRKQENGLDLVHNLIAGGAWAAAEYYSDQIIDSNLKLLSTAYLRLAYNDRKSAMILLKELLKTPYKTHASLLSALVAWSERANKKMQNYLDDIDVSALSSWEKDYLTLMTNQH
jgi:tetratricopeptide (TPR) repeat protein